MTTIPDLVQNALAAALLTAGVVVLLRCRWWTYIAVAVAGYGALLIAPAGVYGNYPAFLISLLLPTAICILIAWAITRLVQRPKAAAARGPRSGPEVPRL